MTRNGSGRRPARLLLIRDLWHSARPHLDDSDCPRRTYTQSHIDYVAEVVIDVAEGATEMGGYRIVEQAPWLRHFTATFEPVT